MGVIISYFLIYKESTTKAGGIRGVIITMLVISIAVGTIDFVLYQNASQESTVHVYQHSEKEGFQTYQAKGPVSVGDHIAYFKDADGNKQTVYGETIIVERN